VLPASITIVVSGGPVRLVLAATGYALFVSLVAAGPDNHTRSANALFSKYQSDHAPGLAVLVIQDGASVFEKGYGVTDLRTLHKIDAQTNFRLASDTKQFTAMSIMLLVHDGKLRYEDRLTDIFPDFPKYGRGITVWQLLNHTSGLLDYEDLMPKPDPAVLSAEQVPQIQDSEVLELLKQQKTTKFPPGSKWDYSNSGYVLLGTIVAKVSGMSFPEFLRERIFAPLEMSTTVAYVKGKNEISHRAYGHSKQGNKWIETDQSPTSATLGDGGVYSSLEDLAKWDKALLDDTLLSEEEFRLAVTPVKVPGAGPVEPDGTPAEYGFGWFLNSYKGHWRMWHYGETMGFRGTIQRYQEDKLTIIILCNRTDLTPAALSLKLADNYLPGRK
jgi:CubicO group peptidase (beta-lactamase class C family)